MKMISAILAAALLSGCAKMQPAETAAWICVGADVASTAVGLHDGLKEGNRLYGQKNVVLKAIVLNAGFNVGLHYLLKKSPRQDKKVSWFAVGAFHCSAAAWNVDKILEHDRSGAP